MEENTNKNKIFVYLLTVFFAVFVGTQLFLILSKGKDQKQELNSTENKTIVEIPTQKPVSTDGYMTLESRPEGYSLAKDVVIAVAADSMGKNIVGYDVIIGYDPVNFDFVTTNSKLTDFKIYTYKRGENVILTGVKELGGSTSSVFDGNSIIDLVFKPKKAGQYEFSLITAINNDKTQLVTDSTEQLNPEVDALTIEVK